MSELTRSPEEPGADIVDFLSRQILEINQTLDHLRTQDDVDDPEEIQHSIYYAERDLRAMQQERLEAVLSLQYGGQHSLEEVIALLAQHDYHTPKGDLALCRSAVQAYRPGQKIHYKPLGPGQADGHQGTITKAPFLEVYVDEDKAQFMMAVEIEVDGVTDYESFPVRQTTGDTIAVIDIQPAEES